MDSNFEKEAAFLKYRRMNLLKTFCELLNHLICKYIKILILLLRLLFYPNKNYYCSDQGLLLLYLVDFYHLADDKMDVKTLWVNA